MTFYHIFSNDAYEVGYSPSQITSITRYREKRTTIGESLDFDDLPGKLQEQLTQRFNELTENEASA